MTSTDIYSSGFPSTYLYVKQHSITGKLYFGKTVKNPETYQGSGKHWLHHIKKHGKEHVETLWYCLFLTREECVEFALMFSSQENIVESGLWLNLKSENGLDGGGGFAGHHHSKDTILKMTTGKRIVPRPYRRWVNIKGHSDEAKLKMSEAKRGVAKSDDHKLSMSKGRKGIPWTQARIDAQVNRIK